MFIVFQKQSSSDFMDEDSFFKFIFSIGVTGHGSSQLLNSFSISPQESKILILNQGLSKIDSTLNSQRNQISKVCI